jgi:hypothetical protein
MHSKTTTGISRPSRSSSKQHFNTGHRFKECEMNEYAPPQHIPAIIGLPIDKNNKDMYNCTHENHRGYEYIFGRCFK